MDFNILYPNSSTIVGMWGSVYKKMIEFLKENVKDKKIKILLNNSLLNSTYYHFLYNYNIKLTEIFFCFI